MKQIIRNENFRQLAHSRTEIKRSEEKPRRCRQSVKHHGNIFSQPEVATREYDWDLRRIFRYFPFRMAEWKQNRTQTSQRNKALYWKMFLSHWLKQSKIG